MQQVGGSHYPRRGQDTPEKPFLPQKTTIDPGGRVTEILSLVVFVLMFHSLMGSLLRKTVTANKSVGFFLETKLCFTQEGSKKYWICLFVDIDKRRKMARRKLQRIYFLLYFFLQQLCIFEILL